MEKRCVPMTKDHPRWEEFLDRLVGPEGCNFREDADGKVVQDCCGVYQPLAIRILKKMGGIDIPASIEYFEENGGFCDCEILFNVAPEYLEGEPNEEEDLLALQASILSGKPN